MSLKGVRSKRNRTRRNRTKKRGGGQSWAIVQYDDRPLSKAYQELVERNKHYCGRHNYEHAFINSGYEDLPPYWRKVRCVKDKLFTDKYKGILWLDTDAGVVQLDKTLDSLIEPNRDFYMSGDLYGVYKDSHSFNAGVWAVMNTPKGKEIMEHWMNTYDANQWKKNNGKWSTTSAWSGSTYEQGSFREKVLPVFLDNLKILDTNFLQGIKHDVPDMFIYHRYDSRKNNVRKFLDKNPI